MTSLLGCNHLSVRFFNQKEKVLEKITVSFQEGEKVLILGPSGSGKSTLLSVFAGIIPEHIEAEVSGEVTRKQNIGVMFQDPDAQFCMHRVDEEIAFSLENRNVPREEMDDIIVNMLELVGLDIDPTTLISTLSGGMKQRLALACLLALKPDVLFFDEPTAQLDPLSRMEIFTLLKETAEKTKQTMIFVEHVLDGCIEWMDRVILLNSNGQIIADGKPADILINYEAQMDEAGIWKPKIFPHTWQDIIQDEQHPISKKLIEQLETRQNKSSCKKEETAPVIEIKDLAIQYGKKPVLQHIDTTIHKGEWVSIIGKNGSGKSTFLKAIAQLLKRKSGDIRIHGKELKRWSDKELYKTVGFVFQNPELQFINQTVFEEVAFSGRQQKWSEEEIFTQATSILTEFGLKKHRDFHPFTLSFGQKRRLSVATMLLLDQDILLLDEPTFGQDRKSAQQLLDLLKRRQEEGTTIVMVTHDMDIVDRYSDRVILFENGGITYNGDPFSFFQTATSMKNSSILPPLPYKFLMERKGEKHVNGQSILSIHP
ncbi:ABC transporter ATP-binding protein [Niallia sp. 01092]|uniref:ABC transporter ATP-binding protein n=1 Tax=unclassified Niallia TaxID=2837522 RepID=UPI003FD206D9